MSKKRAVLLLTMMIAALAVASGVALAATINCLPNGLTCNGTTQNDTLIGTELADSISAKAGDDQLYGLAEGDNLFGDDGADQLHGDIGRDLLAGGPGKDVSDGGADPDQFAYDANWGKDTILDSTTDNTVYFRRTGPHGGPGGTTGSPVTANLTIDLCSDCRVDVIHDVTLPEVTDAAGTNTIDWSGDVIRDVYNLGYGNDYVLGNEGNNQLSSYYGVDHVSGFGGDDRISVQDFGSDDVVDCGAGYDTVLYDGPGRNSSGFLTRGDRVTNCEVLQPS